jgi:1,4-dihydroxy-2-naphthoate octaprenyltransferase
MSLRAPFLIASVIPATLGIVLAYEQVGAFDGQLAALTLVGIAFMHLSNSVMNDNFDFRSGADPAVEHKNPFAGGSRVLLAGRLSLRAHLALGLALLALGTAIGIVLVLKLGGLDTQAGRLLLLIGAIGFGTNVFYVGPPLRLAHRGVGEVAVGLSFGPLIVLGAYVVQAGSISLAAVLLSLSMGCLITGILWINEFPDVPSDLKAGKRTLMARLGTERAERVYEGLLVGGFAFPAAAWLAASAPPTVLLPIAVAPVALKAVGVARAHHADPMALIPANGMTILLTAIFGVLLIAGLGLAVVFHL